MTAATGLKFCYAGVGLTLVIVLAELAAFQLHLVGLPVAGFFPLIVVTLAPAIAGVAIYQKSLKSK